MSGKHGREAFYIVGEGMRAIDRDGRTVCWDAGPGEEASQFRFSRMIPGLEGTPNSDDLLHQLAVVMVSAGGGEADPNVPAGYTYLGQFVDHDMTLDPSELQTRGAAGGLPRKSLRSPTLDLDSLYGDGPDLSPQFYRADRVRLLTGAPTFTGDTSPTSAEDGYDLPRRGAARDGERGTEREAKIPDIRNDENLAVAQVHAAFIRFHNRIVDTLEATGTPGAVLFTRARELATLHYQWMLREDYLKRVADPAVVDEVWRDGRRLFEAHNPPLTTMPVEFSGAAFRLGHSQIRTGYEWNQRFGSHEGALDSGHLFRLFRFSGTSGNLQVSPTAPGSPEDLANLENPPEPAPDFGFADHGKRLPSNWVADLTRLFDFSRFAGDDPRFVPAAERFNHAMALDTRLVDPLALLPIGSFGATSAPLLKKRNLAFRNLVRGRMLGLPSGQQLVRAMRERGLDVPTLTRAQLLGGAGGVTVTAEDVPALEELVKAAPLWFYVLREAEFNGHRLGGVGARIVAETFHRAMQASQFSIVANAAFRPTLGPGAASGRFDMADLLHFAFEGRADKLNPH